MKIEEKISGIWDNPYVCELGIIEHIDECNNLYAEWQKFKAFSNPVGELSTVNLMRKQWKNELADLYLILDKFLSDELIKQRIERFKEKQGV